MDNVVYDLENEIYDMTDEYIFVHKSLLKAELVCIKGEEDIALKFARQMCENEYVEFTASMLSEGMAGCSSVGVECKNVIFLCGDMDISKELLQMICKKSGQRKLRLFFIGNGRIPTGVSGMAIVEIRPEKRCGIARKDGIGIEMWGPNCTGLTRFSLRYKKLEEE